MIDLDRINLNTFCNKDLLDKITQCIEDPRKEERLAKQECVICFYFINKIGGAAITHSNCINCNSEMVFGSTCVDYLCLECAKSMRLCIRCASDINLKNRRKI